MILLRRFFEGYLALSHMHNSRILEGGLLRLQYLRQGCFFEDRKGPMSGRETRAHCHGKQKVEIRSQSV